MWKTIKNILKKNNGTCIIVEEGKPVYVVTQFEEYEKMLNGELAAEMPMATPVKKIIAEKEVEMAEKINQEIIDWKAKQAENNPEINLSDLTGNDELKIENLPFV